MANVSCTTGASVNTTSSNDTSDDVMELPIIVSYIILLFRIISTVYVTVVSIGVVVIVIKEKNDFKGRQISLIINLMVSGILSAINATVQSSIMIISYIAGVNDPIRCDILFVTLSTFHVNAFAFFMLSIDKFVAIYIPLRYNSILTNRIVHVMIFLSWAVSLVTSIIRFFIGEMYRKSSQYGVCIPDQESFTSLMINFIAPIFLSCLGALFVDIYSSVTVCKLNYRSHRHCEEGLQETSPPQTTSVKSMAKLGRTLDKCTGYNMKSIVAVLVGLASNCLIGFICPVLYVTVQTLHTNTTYRFYEENIVIPNAAYCFLIIYTMIYSLYFSNIRKPMCLMMKQLLRRMRPQCCHLNVATRRSRVLRIAPASRHSDSVCK